MADVVLPGAAYTEKDGTYVNMEGRSQSTRRAVTPPALAREDWKIVRALSEIAGKTLPYDDIMGVRARMEEIAPHLTRYERVESALFSNVVTTASKASAGAVLTEPLVAPMRRLRDY